jgi:non-ribosomal peptide synthetase component F
VAAAYEGRLTTRRPAAQYDDYVHWLGQPAHAVVTKPTSRTGERRLDPLPDVLRLPFERDTATGAPRGALIERPLDTSTQEGVGRLAASAGATPFTIYALAFRLLLHRYTDGQRVAFATPVSTRAHAAAVSMIGYFLNPIVVCADIDERESVACAAARFGDDLRDMIAHATAPFDEIAARLVTHREPDRHPIFQAMFVYREATPAPALGETQLHPLTLDLGASKFDLTLFVDRGRGRARNRHRIPCRPLRRGLDRTGARALRDAACRAAGRSRPARARRADAGRRGAAAHVGVGRGPHLDGPEMVLLPPQVLAQARRQPREAAVTCGGAACVTTIWSAPDGPSPRRWLTGGVTPGDRVALFLPRSTQMIAGVVGIHLAGPPTCRSTPRTRRRATAGPARRRGGRGRGHELGARRPPAGGTVAIGGGRRASTR